MPDYDTTNKYIPETLLLSVSAVVRGAGLGLVLVVQGQVVEDLAHAAQGHHVVLERAVRHAF